MQTVAELWRSRPGRLNVDPVVNFDESGLWTLVSRWRDVGSYRRASSGDEVKFLLTPVLLHVVNEPSAYLGPGELAGDDDPWLGGS